MTDSPIFIPTRGRITKQVTLHNFSPALHARTHLVCPPEEAEELEKRYGKLGLRVLPTPPDVDGIGPTRQWFVEWAIAEGYDRLLMLDDDLRFFERLPEPERHKFRTLGSPKLGAPAAKHHDEAEQVIDAVFGLLELTPLAGLANRSGANRLKEGKDIPIKRNCRMHDLLCLDLTVYDEGGFDIGRMKFMEDFDLILQYLAAGYETMMWTENAKGDDGSGQKGGCSIYRDAAGQSLAATALAMEWPDFVKLEQKNQKGKDSEGDFWFQRWDVRVSWAKAAKAGQAK